MLGNSQHDILINGGGFTLIEESYRRQPQQPFAARFSTGDASTGDLSFWQFLTQKGWTGEGQEKFDVVTKYRQSAGWDLRDGKARLARGIESVNLSAAVPAISSPSATYLFDDFESGFSTVKWDSSIDFPFSSQGTFVVSGVRGGYNGLNVAGNGLTCEARGSAAGSGNSNLTGIVMTTDTGIPDTGEWRFTVVTNTFAVSAIHAAVLVFGNDTGSYVIEFKGSNMTSWVVKRTTSVGTAAFYNDNDTTVATLVATGGSAVGIECKVTRDSSGNWEVFENGISLGTFTDNTYTDTKYFAFKVRWAANTLTSVVDSVYFPGPATTTWGQTSKFLNYYNALYTCWDSGAAAFTFTTMRSASTASNLPKISHVNAKDIAVWNRDGSPTNNLNTYLVASNGTTIRAYNGETQVMTETSTIVATCLFPLNSTTLIVLGTTSGNNGIPAIEVWKMTAESWTVTSKVVLQLDGATSGVVCPYAALDSNGALYFVTTDMSLSLGTSPSRLFYISSADMLATLPTVTASWNLTDFIARGLYSFQGTIYIFGARKRGTDSYSAIIKLDGTSVYESSKAISLASIANEQNFFNHGIPCVWRNLDHVLVLSQTGLDLWDPVLQIDSSLNIRECASFDSGQFDSALPNINAIAEWNGAFYCLNGQAGTIKRTSTSRGGLVGDPLTCVLEMSEMGANTDLINKTLYSVTAELSAVVPSGETLTVFVNDTSVGTMVLASGTRKEIVLSSELTASRFTVKLSWPKASTWTGYVRNGPLLKYIPTQFKKKQWAFGLRLTNDIKLADGTREPRTPAAMAAEIEAAWASNVPVTLTDIDGVDYSVIITSYDIRRPLLSRDKWRQEGLCFVEALEV